MGKRIIISGKERILNPFISFVMSLIITGTGEIYTGSYLRGIVLALLRIVTLLSVPFYSFTNVKSSYITEVFFSLSLFILISLFSPFNAAFISLKKKKIIISELCSIRFIAGFSIFNLSITFISIVLFYSSFPIIMANDNYPPLIEKGDIAVVKRINNASYGKGEMVMPRDRDIKFVRIIGQPNEEISYNKGRFSNQGTELPLSIYSEEEMKKYSMTDYDVISESQDNIKYPVIQDRHPFAMNIKLSNNEYFTAPDDRNEIAGFAIIKNINLYGRVEGLLISLKRKKILIKPFQIQE